MCLNNHRQIALASALYVDDFRDTLPYNLYLGSVPGVLNTGVWGDGSGGTPVWQGSMTLSTGQMTRTDTTTIAAALPAGTVPASGAYGDTVIATIVFR